MNTNIKLFQSALGLAIGLWMIACGSTGYQMVQSKGKTTKIAPKSKLASGELARKPFQAMRAETSSTWSVR
ncbi:hypothetical protein ACFQ4C_02485 [Larkinella insperata]|uniref:Lipoprotein n=1 Tax=Larkinella insperata TaxID=332158 RepID=A0ABW3Q619_9BACT|nr:hypothetical protein [Larkinella insperata]